MKEPKMRQAMGAYVDFEDFEDDTPIGEMSDGHHTFNELYYHRMILFATICKHHPDIAWKSMKHHDGTMFDNYFIVGIETPSGQFSYHYHVDHWDLFKVGAIPNAPEWDGHTSEDVIRLLVL